MKPLARLAVVLALASWLLVADAQGHSVPLCPQFWHFYRGACYAYFGDRVNWETAHRSCQDIYTNQGRAELASIHDVNENSFVYDLFRMSAGNTPQSSHPTYYGVWLGLNRHGSSWIWTDGTSYDYRNWRHGQPDDWRDVEDCGHFWRVDGGDDTTRAWNDLECALLLPYMCKLTPYSVNV